jgi:hypothetical protein
MLFLQWVLKQSRVQSYLMAGGVNVEEKSPS